MSYIMVDIEADGPIPKDYSMICFGAVLVDPDLSRTFYGKLKPISDKWIPEALKVSWCSGFHPCRGYQLFPQKYPHLVYTY